MEKFLVATIFTTTLLLFGTTTCSKLGETCNRNSNCDWGLQCGMCLANGSLQPKCTQLLPNHPYLQVKGLPFNRYSWLTTHSSYATMGMRSTTGHTLLAPTNQEDTITDQLNNGIRGLMLDVQDYNNTIYLCYGQCSNFTAFQPAINVLNEVRIFLEANPSEIVTIFLEDQVASPNGLNKIFDLAGLREFWFPVSLMPKNGGNWPIIDTLITENHRLLVFTSKSEKEASEGIASRWKYIVENQNGNGSCSNRPESYPLNIKTKSLILMNHYQSIPNILQACTHNSASLLESAEKCSFKAGNRWPNFIALDFYKRSVEGETLKAVNKANGRNICGCDDITLCRKASNRAHFGACKAR